MESIGQFERAKKKYQSYRWTPGAKDLILDNSNLLIFQVADRAFELSKIRSSAPGFHWGDGPIVHLVTFIYCRQMMVEIGILISYDCVAVMFDSGRQTEGQSRQFRQRSKQNYRPRSGRT